MHSPNKLVKKNTINYHNDNEDLKLLMNNNNLNSVDSILMHNYPYMLSSPQLYNNNNNNNTNNNYHHQQQQHQMYHQIQQQQYRRVRPEPVNEKSIVGSMVGFFHDVVGTSENHHTKHSQRQQSTSHTHHHHGNIVQSGSSTLLSNVTAVTSTPPSEIKEQIEWLHYEHLNMLDSSKSFHKTISNNILLVLGYKTGFSVWNIDVIIIIIINLFIKNTADFIIFIKS
jgi:hypothetical protein